MRVPLDETTCTPIVQETFIALNKEAQDSPVLFTVEDLKRKRQFVIMSGEVFELMRKKINEANDDH